jgi:hypothetical protein
VDVLQPDIHVEEPLRAMLPLAAHSGPAHIRVPLAAGVLGRTRDGTDGACLDSNGTHAQVLVAEMGGGLFEQRLKQFIDQQKTTRIQNRCSVRNATLESGRSTRSPAALFYRRSRPPDPHRPGQATLEENLRVRVQQFWNAHLLAADAADLGINRPDRQQQVRPRQPQLPTDNQRLAGADPLLHSGEVVAGNAAFTYSCPTDGQGQLKAISDSTCFGELLSDYRLISRKSSAFKLQFALDTPRFRMPYSQIN